jgi:hypothetical protein
MFFIFLTFFSSPSHLRAEYVSTFKVVQDGTVTANIGSGGDVLAVDDKAWREGNASIRHALYDMRFH